jgi:uncharacterized UBP type Zn finger protein
MDFEEAIKRLKLSLIRALGKEYKEFGSESKKDIEDFINYSKDKLEKWTVLLATKKITIEEYEWLVRSQEDFMKLKELEKTGISKIRLGQVKNKMVKAIIDIGKSMALNLK